MQPIGKGGRRALGEAGGCAERGGSQPAGPVRRGRAGSGAGVALRRAHFPRVKGCVRRPGPSPPPKATRIPFPPFIYGFGGFSSPWLIFLSGPDWMTLGPPSPGSQSGCVLASPHPYPGGVSFGARNSAGDKWPWPHSPRGDRTCRGNFPKGTGGGQSPLEAPLCPSGIHCPVCLLALQLPAISSLSWKASLTKGSAFVAVELSSPKISCTKQQAGAGAPSPLPPAVEGPRATQHGWRRPPGTHRHRSGPCRCPWLVQRGGHQTWELCASPKTTSPGSKLH